MKATKLMLFVAAATLLFGACGDDDDNNSTLTEVAPNTLIINGTTYNIISHYEFGGGDRSYAGAYTEEMDESGAPVFDIISDVEDYTLNHTFDLTKSYDESSYFFEVRNATYTKVFRQVGHGPLGEIDNVEYENGIFEEGTLTITKNDNVFEYKVIGKLKNGEDFAFYISVPSSEWAIR